MLRRAHYTDHDPDRRWLLLTGGGACLAILMAAGAFAAGRASSGAATSASPAVSVTGSPPAISNPSATAGPTRVVSGVPEGFAHSRVGAVAAAREFLAVEVGDLMSRPEAYRAAWREMCTPEYFTSTGRSEAESVITNQEANNHLISNAAAGQAVYERAFPLAAAVVAYADDRVTVRTWALVVAHPGDGPTILSFAAGTLELRWIGGDWKLDGGRASSSSADGASGPLRLDDGPALPAYLATPTPVDDVPPSR